MVWTRQYIRLRPSRRLAVYLIFIHAIAVIGVVATPLSTYLGVALVAVAAICLVHGLRRYVLLWSPRSVTALIFDCDGVWSLEFGDGSVFDATLRPGALIHPRLMVLSFRCSRWGGSVLLIGDNADPDQVRRLRVRLRLNGGSGADQAQDQGRY